MKRMSFPNSAATKWYAISKENWKKLINYLHTLERDVARMTEEEKDIWDCYYVAKGHGKNEKGLFELPYKRWETVNKI
jgi:uncharacterized protein (UPF0335 family)